EADGPGRQVHVGTRPRREGPRRLRPLAPLEQAPGEPGGRVPGGPVLVAVRRPVDRRPEGLLRHRVLADLSPAAGQGGQPPTRSPRRRPRPAPPRPPSAVSAPPARAR